MTDVVDLIAPAALIAVLRMGDVTLNVFKTVAVIEGRRVAAPILQALESLLWLLAAGIVFAEMTPIRVAGFTVGVMAGTVIGMEVIRRLQLGMVTVRIYSRSDAPDASTVVGPDGAPAPGATTAVPAGPQPHVVLEALHRAGHRATVFPGRGREGPVEMTMSTVRRREVRDVIATARKAVPDAFISVDNDLSPSTMTTGDRG